MSLDLTSLRKAVTALEAAATRAENDTFMASMDEIARNIVRSGVVRYFEFTYELCWKFIRRWIKANSPQSGADHPRTRKDLFRLAARHGLIADPLPWFEYGEARNLTSRMYNEETASAVFETALKFAPGARDFLTRLETAND